MVLGFPGRSVIKNLTASAGDMGSTPESGRSPGEENGNPLQYPCLGNSMDRGAGGLQCTGSEPYMIQSPKQQCTWLDMFSHKWPINKTKLYFTSTFKIYTVMTLEYLEPSFCTIFYRHIIQLPTCPYILNMILGLLIITWQTVL